ncbi:MAG TPA: MerR family transcriptional regulator [Phaeodactylibacter sp.]|nr:MerR family transcriptional regulator [Phaeodactylibacter sp.]
MEDQMYISIKSFCRAHEIGLDFIEEVLEYELIEVQKTEDDLLLPEEQLERLERILRLHYELGINMPGIDVILRLLERFYSF